MKLKDITPNDGDVFHVGAGTVTYNDGWWVGNQRITDGVFDIIGELEVNDTVLDSDGSPIVIGKKYTIECVVNSVDPNDGEGLNANVTFDNYGRSTSTWVHSSLLTSSNEA